MFPLRNLTIQIILIVEHFLHVSSPCYTSARLWTHLRVLADTLVKSILGSGDELGVCSTTGHGIRF